MLRNTVSVEVAEGSQAKLWAKYHAEYENRGMKLEYAIKAWQENLVNLVDCFKLFSLSNEDAVIGRAASTGESVVVTHDRFKVVKSSKFHIKSTVTGS